MCVRCVYLSDNAGSNHPLEKEAKELRVDTDKSSQRISALVQIHKTILEGGWVRERVGESER